eukprot:Phypoly_transcript_08796.p1 GENE.Phypoly_transcript_08796~~Phypoly_transcript_08796.p1  ORF type:complete len:288 (+),score=12.84 Phypoly_transcript_08796:221-1084(+)
MLGFDTESVKRTVVLLQLSTYDRCVLVRLTNHGDIAQNVIDLLGNRNISKVGAEIYGDALDLLHDHDLFTHGLINLSPYYRFGMRQLGLRNMFEQEYECQWIKDKSITCSNWSCNPLSLLQVKYAALDAWVSYMVGLRVVQEHEPSLTHMDLYPIILYRLAVVNKQMTLMNDIQKRTIKVLGTAEVQGDPFQVSVRQIRYEKRVRNGYNIFAVTGKGIVKGKVKSTMGKTANFVMDKALTDQVVYVFLIPSFIFSSFIFSSLYFLLYLFFFIFSSLSFLLSFLLLSS